MKGYGEREELFFFFFFLVVGGPPNYPCQDSASTFTYDMVTLLTHYFLE